MAQIPLLACVGNKVLSLGAGSTGMSYLLQGGGILPRETGAVRLNKQNKWPGDMLHTAALCRSITVRL